MDLSKMGKDGEITDKRNLSLKDAGNFLELLAESISSEKPLSLPLALTLVSALYDAASKAKAGDQKAAIAAISQAMGLQIGHKRPAAPFWKVISRISVLIERGVSQTEAITITSKELGIGKSTADDYWAKYKEQQLEVIHLVETLVKNR